MNLLSPVPITTVDTSGATYSSTTVQTVARIMLEHMTPTPYDELTQEIVSEAIAELSPWQPIGQGGRMAKRLATYLHKKYNAQLPQQVVGTIGNYLNDDLPFKGITYEIRKDFGWNPGEYGDKGSCFFGAGDPTLTRLTKSDAHALLWYDSSGKGCGRAIVLPASQDGSALVVNAYGPSLEQVMSRLKVIDPERHYQVVNVREADFYINLNTGLLAAMQPYGHDTVYVTHRLPRIIRHPYDRHTVCVEDELVVCQTCQQPAPANTFARFRYNSSMVCENCLNAEVGTCGLTGLQYPVAELADLDIVRPTPNRAGSYDRTTITAHRRYRAMSRCETCNYVLVAHFAARARLHGHVYAICGACRNEYNMTVCKKCGLLKQKKVKCDCERTDNVQPSPHYTFTTTSSDTISITREQWPTFTWTPIQNPAEREPGELHTTDHEEGDAPAI